jgi:hypothetical protein
VNSSGQQKGVDSLIVTDMITLARNRAMSDAVLVSGDEDIRVGVQQAQEFGVRVHLLGIRPSRGSQSLFLLQEADSTHEWGPENLAPFFACAPPVAAVKTAPAEDVALAKPPLVVDPLVDIANNVALELPIAELTALVESIEHSGQIPKEIDGRLLARGGTALKTPLNSGQKKVVRGAFIHACQRRLSGESS